MNSIPKSKFQKLMNAFPSLEWGTANAMNTHLTNEEINSGIRNRNLGRLYKMMTRRASANYPERLAAAEAAKANANARMAANAARRTTTRTWKNGNGNGNAATRRLRKIMEENAANAKKIEAEKANKKAKGKAAIAEARAAALVAPLASSMSNNNQMKIDIKTIIDKKGEVGAKQAELLTKFPHMSMKSAKSLTYAASKGSPKDKEDAIQMVIKLLRKKAASGASAAAASENAAKGLDGGRRTRRRRSSRRKSMKKRQ